MESLASNEIDRFVCAINRAHGACWAHAYALASDRARLIERPAMITGNKLNPIDSVYQDMFS